MHTYKFVVDGKPANHNAYLACTPEQLFGAMYKAVEVMYDQEASEEDICAETIIKLGRLLGRLYMLQTVMFVDRDLGKENMDAGESTMPVSNVQLFSLKSVMRSVLAITGDLAATGKFEDRWLREIPDAPIVIPSFTLDEWHNMFNYFLAIVEMIYEELEVR